MFFSVLGDAATFLHNLYSLSPVVGLQRRAFENDGDEGVVLWFTISARPKRIRIVVRLLLGLWLRAMIALLVVRVVSSSPLGRFWDVERIALTVAEVVGDALAVAAVFAYFLLERLRLAPVLLQQLLLCDEKRAFARLQDLIAAVRLQTRQQIRVGIRETCCIRRRRRRNNWVIVFHHYVAMNGQWNTIA